MEIALVGLNHKTAPVAVREKCHFPAERLADAYRELSATGQVSESFILSTCNRAEVLFVAENPAEAAKAVREFIFRFHGLTPEYLAPHLVDHVGPAAVRHLFGVAGSIRSLVLGEGQILGQVKKAFEIARGSGHTANILNKLLNCAIACGKRARTETEIGRGAVSVSQAAVELARSIFTHFEKRTVLILGAGKMSEIASKHLKKKEIGTLYFTNRSPEKAKALALKYGGEAVEFERRGEYMEKSDIIISSTSAEGFLIHPPEIAAIMSRRGPRQLFLIDLAVPRDIHPDVEKIDGVFLYSIDDLEKVVQGNLGRRQKEIDRVEAIVEEESADFYTWYGRLKVLPTIQRIKDKMLNYRTVILEQVAKKEGRKINGETVEAAWVNQVTDKMIDKLVRDVFSGLDQCKTEKEWKEYTAQVSRIFGLDKVF